MIKSRLSKIERTLDARRRQLLCVFVMANESAEEKIKKAEKQAGVSRDKAELRVFQYEVC